MKDFIELHTDIIVDKKDVTIRELYNVTQILSVMEIEKGLARLVINNGRKLLYTLVPHENYDDIVVLIAKAKE